MPRLNGQIARRSTLQLSNMKTASDVATSHRLAQPKSLASHNAEF